MMAQATKKRYSSQRKRKYRKAYRKRRQVSSRYQLNSNQAVYKNHLTRIYRETRQTVKCWSLHGVVDTLNIPINVINSNQCVVKWYTTFQPNIGFWNALCNRQMTNN